MNGFDFSTIQNVFIGGAQASSVYLGTTKIWPTSQHDYSQDYFSIKANENDCGVGIYNKAPENDTFTFEYSTDLNTWTSITLIAESVARKRYFIYLHADEIVYIRANNSYWSNSDTNRRSILVTKNADVQGNIMSLLYGSNFRNNNTLPNSYVFFQLFFSSSFQHAHNLILPATTLTESCYESMFYGNSSLISAPELPATTLADSCYSMMFTGCTSLTTAPTILPATTLTYGCYYLMFGRCSSLTTAPELPATTLAERCYMYMFDGCTLLNTITCLAKDMSASNCTLYWVRNVASSGTFTKKPSAPWLNGVNGIPSGWTVQNYVDPHNYANDYLTFKVLTPGTISWKALGTGSQKTIDYSINNGSWTSITSTSAGAEINVVAGDVVRFRGTNSKYASTNRIYSGFEGGTALYNIEGNIMSMTYGDNFAGQTTLTQEYQFCSLFKKSNVVDASNLILPATTLSTYCYRALFAQCGSNFIAAPELPATTLAKGCYYYMFEYAAFRTAPELNAPILEQECYGYMFNNASVLNYIKCLAIDRAATNCTNSWVSGVASSGTFVKDASTIWSSGDSGRPANWAIYDAS